MPARIVISADGKQAFENWRQAFAAVAPDLDVCSWYDPAWKAGADDYALVWHPEPEHMERLAGMQGIVCTGAGVDHLLAHAHFPRSVPLVRMGGEQTARLMADYVLWAVIGLLRDARTWAVQQQQGLWRNNVCCRTSSTTRVGIMGLGHLGAYVAQALAHVGFRVSGWKRTPAVLDGVTVWNGVDNLPSFLAELDVLVNLLPATPATDGLINHALLGHLPKGAGFVNVGRGRHVVQSDLLRALDDGTLCGAVLDVVTPEPLPQGDALWHHPRLTITPHVASEAAREVQARYVADVVHCLARGEKPALLCDVTRGY
ncbi:glyoxylate/hydroxypyruvate reductase A [Acetobacter lambici]|uniref:Glyoxylate/hydroxypyruvate reductase A n=1 Tax=Acetobacter lambici TaxID=1332824 RepID=A0ABT1F2D7_9PROT|nr:glyoxylate/hydroxypyruvate reductase A [Acetobacter lambici]MCP1241894.1 glyoxylate/hydroxypyruvate reductase A [Acetobacter lambici]MCP1257909.1 glyoxylate/hydroxypyruvate reductase A [Acetobacter lambici]NHO56268.1 glyoxylate/hydroxypyruvate reductase A [Acetobacter lambici]